jgi:hypothetical protein
MAQNTNVFGTGDLFFCLVSQAIIFFLSPLFLKNTVSRLIFS